MRVQKKHTILVEYTVYDAEEEKMFVELIKSGMSVNEAYYKSSSGGYINFIHETAEPMYTDDNGGEPTLWITDDDFNEIFER